MVQLRFLLFTLCAYLCTLGQSVKTKAFAETRADTDATPSVGNGKLKPLVLVDEKESSSLQSRAGGGAAGGAADVVGWTQTAALSSIANVATLEKATLLPAAIDPPLAEKRFVLAMSTPLLLLAYGLIKAAERFTSQRVSKALSVTGCAVGLYTAHVGYGFMQEVIMTIPYGSELFPSVACLVAVNRLVAVIAALVAVKLVAKRHMAIFEHGQGSARLACLLPALTNVAASWCQYAALWYVTFPTQMLFKSMKVVPVMIFGRWVLRRTYPLAEYVEACLIAAGVVAFGIWAETDASAGVRSQWLGFLLLVGFLTCDSLTPNLQKRAFAAVNPDAFQMMFYVGTVSLTYSLIVMSVTGQVQPMRDFFLQHPESIVDVLGLSVLSTVGQIFIYHTVKHHGPVSLTLIMTTRQMVSLALSSSIFRHHFPTNALVAVGLVFMVLLERTYRSMAPTEKMVRAPAPPPQTPPTNIFRKDRRGCPREQASSDRGSAASPSVSASGSPSVHSDRNGCSSDETSDTSETCSSISNTPKTDDAKSREGSPTISGAVLPRMQGQNSYRA